MISSARRLLPLIGLIGLFFSPWTGCGSPESPACLAFEDEKCQTDKLCGSPDPCSFRCDRLGVPRDEQALTQCVTEYQAVSIPDELSEPFAHLGACAARSLTATKCILLFAPE